MAVQAAEGGARALGGSTSLYSCRERAGLPQAPWWDPPNGDRESLAVHAGTAGWPWAWPAM